MQADSNTNAVTLAANAAKVTNVNNINALAANTNNINALMVERHKQCKNKAYEYNIKEVQSIASRIADKLNNPLSFKFYCKVAWKLPKYMIWQNLEQALTGKNPRAYFTFLCKLNMQTLEQG